MKMKKKKHGVENSLRKVGQALDQNEEGYRRNFVSKLRRYII